ncbi:MAG: hypothetical protein WAW02_04170 [Sideroxyarcus sp.]
MLNIFVAIVKDAKKAGSRIFSDWVSNPDKFLKKGDLPIDKILLSLSEEEKKKFVPLLEYFTEMSFYYLLKRLEEGESAYSFNLSIKNDNTGEIFSLINDQEDHNIRSSLQEL